MDDTKYSVTKIDAAKRQLDTAIQLWFYDADPVSVHTLAAAAYQITHDIKVHRGVAHDLLYDAAMIKDEYRKQWISTMKKQQNFFKHADNDPDPESTVELYAMGNLLFLTVAMAGLQLFKPDYLKRFKASAQRLGIDDFEDIRAVPKANFFDDYMKISHAKAAASVQ